MLHRAERASTSRRADRPKKLHGTPLLPITALRGSGPVAEVASLSALERLAKLYESAIMVLEGESGTDYLVWENGLLYRYSTNPAAPTTGYAAAGVDRLRATRRERPE